MFEAFENLNKRKNDEKYRQKLKELNEADDQHQSVTRKRSLLTKIESIVSPKTTKSSAPMLDELFDGGALPILTIEQFNMLAPKERLRYLVSSPTTHYLNFMYELSV
jgi:hypothetical protein